jgi:hypothetical protein
MNIASPSPYLQYFWDQLERFLPQVAVLFDNLIDIRGESTYLKTKKAMKSAGTAHRAAMG